ncbi:MAG: cytochrome P460 family protein [Leptolyngbya sp.]|nr:cytochrome P460 family protein [Candidatus Melainabacteria bacterium]
MQSKSKFLILSLTVVGVASLSSIAANSSDSVVNNKNFHRQFLEAAHQYQNYGKVDDMARWAPWLCSAPPPPKARMSTSADLSTHGKKIYYLFAKDRNAYVNQSADQIGQIIVKESWMPPAGSKEDRLDNTTGSAKVPTKKQDLFIMMKLDPKSADTDDGWVYGTVTPDGKEVTSAGRVQSCMTCHTNAQHGRLFGLKN